MVDFDRQAFHGLAGQSGIGAFGFGDVIADQAAVAYPNQMRHQVGEQKAGLVQPADQYIVGAVAFRQCCCRVGVVEQIADAAIGGLPGIGRNLD